MRRIERMEIHGNVYERGTEYSTDGSITTQKVNCEFWLDYITVQEINNIYIYIKCTYIHILTRAHYWRSDLDSCNTSSIITIRENKLLQNIMKLLSGIQFFYFVHWSPTERLVTKTRRIKTKRIQLYVRKTLKYAKHDNNKNKNKENPTLNSNLFI